jgi:lysophospholipase L1-like esterase
MKTPSLFRIGPACILALLLAACEDDGGGSGAEIAPENDALLALAKGDCMSGEGAAGTPGYPAFLGPLAPHMRIEVRGGGAARAADGAAQTPGDLASLKPGYLLILYGKNDVINGVDTDAAAGAIQSMVDAARANGTRPLLATLPGMSGAWQTRFGGAIDALNGRIRSIGSSGGVVLVDLNAAFEGRRSEWIPDGRHPNEAGMRTIAAEFAKHL